VTLNLTLLGEKQIFQCADYRLMNTATGQIYDFDTQKIFLISRRPWNATVCFAGVGSTPDLSVADWVRERIDAILPADPFDRLLEELMKAEAWLRALPEERRRHSFSIGAFVENEAQFWRVTNFEQPAAVATSNQLLASRVPLVGPAVYASGSGKSSVTEQHRASLIAVLSRELDEETIYKALANVTRKVAATDRTVSAHCFVGHVNILGKGGGKPYGLDGRVVSRMGTALRMNAAMDDHPIFEQLSKMGELRGGAFARGQSDEKFLKLQVALQPNSADAHSNLATHFMRARDYETAERLIKRALELDPRHGSVLANYALIADQRGDLAEAERRYADGIAANPDAASLYQFYTTFLQHEGRFAEALGIATRGIARFPQQANFHYLCGGAQLAEKLPKEALASFRKALELGANQKQCQVKIALAAHLAGEPLGTCIAEYLTALALWPDEAGSHLNLAQLLFIRGDHGQANFHLDEAFRLGLSERALLEYLVYKICHRDDDWEFVRAQASTILAKGKCLDWDMTRNVEAVRSRNPAKAKRVEVLLESLRGNIPIAHV
jgi:Tfp pilus assembly protein PilF